ncbi:unnamed protein product [Lampetra planeri]
MRQQDLRPAMKSRRIHRDARARAACRGARARTHDPVGQSARVAVATESEDAARSRSTPRMMRRGAERARRVRRRRHSATVAQAEDSRGETTRDSRQ